jgi:diguanylate cyclase (GGDEF)-like protein/PAS domain S-box-containing protein
MTGRSPAPQPSAASGDSPSAFERQRAQAVSVRRLTARIAANTDLDAALGELVDLTRSAFGADGSLVLANLPSGSKVTHSSGVTDTWAGVVPRLIELLSADEGPGWTAMAITDVRADRRLAGMRRELGRQRFRALSVARLAGVDGMVGSISLYHRDCRAYDEEDLDALTSLAEHVSIAIRHAEAVRQRSGWEAQLASIHDLGSRLSALVTVPQIATATVNELDRIVRFHSVRFYIIEGEMVVPVAWRGVLPEYLEESRDQLTVRLGQGATGWVAQHGISQYLPDASNDPRTTTMPGTEPGIDESLLLVPMVQDAVVIGVIVLSKLGLDQFTSDERRLLEIYATLAGQAMVNAQATDQRLRDSEARLRAVVDSVEDAVVTCDRNGTIVAWNGGAQRVFGLVAEEALGRQWRTLIAAGSRQRVATAMDGLLATGGQERATMQLMGHRSTGPDFAAELSMASWRMAGEPFVTVMVRDITRRRALEEQLQHQAFHDPLTGLANRALFADRVEHALARGRRSGGAVAVLFLDLDDFKTVNDGIGHAAGDALLRAVADRVQGCLRSGDTASRLGGDEFAILLEDLAGSEEAEGVAERILASLAEPLTIHGHQVAVRASIGIAHSVADRDRSSELLRNADLAMYVAKRAGKGRSQVYEPSMQAAVVTRLELAGDIRRAMDRGDFVVHYQPIVDLREGTIVGHEALVRWLRRRERAGSTTELIATAEETGQIFALGRLVLDEACRQANEWQTLAPSVEGRSMSVNVSARQLIDPGFPDAVANSLHESGLDPRALVLEITEGIVMDDWEAALDRLHSLKALGVRLAVDDFGTGYSSLSYLRRLPVDILKVDQSFIEAIDVDEEASELARVILRIGRTLRLQVIAEGVEREAQATRLRQLGYRLAQGFWLGPPEPADLGSTRLRAATAEGAASSTAVV